ncbi:MAG: tyrosine-protein phosphatase [Deltaproteobacteria bacterium]|nr:tyrosine-protein phosphatase [Deltaproteobacteria bacterium]
MNDDRGQATRLTGGFIQLEGCFNFRDLGGYPTGDGRVVRSGWLFRSDALQHLTRHDVAYLRDEVGLRHVIDLRSTYELRIEGRGPLAHEPLHFHHLPLFDGDTRQEVSSNPMTLADRYFLLAKFAMQPIARVIETIAQADAPLVYHCAAGKDRTGVISAVLLGVLGVADDEIVNDYVLTKENLNQIIDRLATAKGYEVALEAMPADTLHAEPETMIDFLQRLRREYGSLCDYARAAGVRADSLERLGATLLVAPEDDAAR